MNLLAYILTFVLMEVVAWFTHRYLMHGLLWSWHEDHHFPQHKTFEKNDLFFLIFALPGILLIYFGIQNTFDIYFFIGLGISTYGLAYFLIHDVFIHRRFKWFDKTNNWYFRTIRKVHKLHHKSLLRDNSKYFGMLWIPFHFFKSK